MVDRGPGGLLPSLVQPGAGDHRREVGSPDARDESRLIGGGHGARGRAEDVAHGPRRIARLARPGADRSDTAGMGVDQARSDRGARNEAKVFRRGPGQARTEPGARLDHLLPDAGEVTIGKIFPYHLLAKDRTDAV